jgi:plastocyanin
MNCRTIRCRPRAATFALTLLLVAGLAGLAGLAGAAEPAYTVKLEHFMFTPGTLTVPVGATVRWENLDGEPHTTVSIDGVFRSGALDQGDAYSYTFKTAGKYRYVCSIHPQMVGTIVVTEAR